MCKSERRLQLSCANKDCLASSSESGSYVGYRDQQVIPKVCLGCSVWGQEYLGMESTGLRSLAELRSAWRGGGALGTAFTDYERTRIRNLFVSTQVKVSWIG